MTITLDQITDFPGLIEYFRDELDWEIPEGLSYDDSVYHYTADELGLKIEAQVEITQLRPILGASEPWGVFFVNFDTAALPITMMRRILNRVSKKKRESANDPQRALFNKNDLLFISAFGEANDRRLALAHFHQDHHAKELPTLRVLAWDRHDTGRRLANVEARLKDKLRWPQKRELPEAWRQRWGEAFTERPRQAIHTAKEMATALAQVARRIRDDIKELLPQEKAGGQLTQLFEAVQQTLSRDLDVDKFADTYAQTIAYGLLSARINQVQTWQAEKARTLSNLSLDNITADAVGDAMPTTNPFLKELFGSFLTAGGRDGDSPGLDFDELGVGEVVALLNDPETHMESVLLDFDKQKAGDDPVIHFYEGFLTAYDKALKVQRGVFYTPRPVVSFIVRSVDEVLKTQFGLADGLADTTTWGQFVASHPGTSIPAGMTGSEPFVRVLDPATGTGTFLVEAIDLIYSTMTAKWKSQGLSAAARLEAWNAYVPSHLLPRLFGFELMMAAYAVAHMKIGLKLADTGYRFEGVDDRGRPARASVFLTNALEPARDLDSELEFMSEALAHEAQATNAVKKAGGFTVIIGNPPYANYSSNLTEQARSLVDRYRDFRGSPIKERNQLQFERNIQDDYIKFVAIAEAFLKSSGAGVLGYITNATSLSSPSLRGMRERMLGTFSRINEIHLHGGTNETSDAADGDQNVFDIAQAVAVHLYMMDGTTGNNSISFSEMWGKRESKYELLSHTRADTIQSETIHPDIDNCTFSPQSELGGIITVRFGEAFDKYGGGIKTNRDDIAIGFTQAECFESAQAFLKESGNTANSSLIENILYRPFDVRYIYYDEKVVKSRSLPTMQHLIGHSNLGLLASSSWTSPERFSVNVSDKIVEMKSGTHDRGTTLFPLYRFEHILNGPAHRVSNLSQAFSDRWRSLTGRKIVLDRNDKEIDDDCESVFHYMYALCYASEYRRAFRSAIAQGFPLICFPNSVTLFQEMAAIGQELVALHRLDPVGAPVLADPKNRFVAGSEARVGAMTTDVRRTSAGRVYINDQCWFETVPEGAWSQWMGGYQPAQKWLKDRSARGGQKVGPGRVLTPEDQLHYRRMIVALSRTSELTDELDQVIVRHGGWPAAFKGMAE